MPLPYPFYDHCGSSTSLPFFPLSRSVCSTSRSLLLFDASAYIRKIGLIKCNPLQVGFIILTQCSHEHQCRALLLLWACLRAQPQLTTFCVRKYLCRSHGIPELPTHRRQDTRGRSSGSSPTRAQAPSHVLAMSRQCAIFCVLSSDGSFTVRQYQVVVVSVSVLRVSCHGPPSPPPKTHANPTGPRCIVVTFAMRIGNWRSKVDPHRCRIFCAGSASARLAEERDATGQLHWDAVGMAK